MPFSKIVVALDGSKNSQIAAEYGFWLATNLDAELAGQHVVDPRLVDFFIEPEFAEELGFGQSVETSEKVFVALRKIGKTILELFAREASGRNLKTTTFLAEGHTLEEIVTYAEEFDLLVLGHRGRYERKLPARIMLGSIAERAARESSVPVLITVQPVSEIKEVLVAFDGSEPSLGALLLGESLAKNTGCNLRVMTVIPSSEQKPQAQLLVENGEKFLREYWPKDVFTINEGEPVSTILGYANKAHSLLILGAYGYSDPDKNVLGSTTSSIIRRAQTSLLVYKPKHSHKAKTGHEKMERIFA